MTFIDVITAVVILVVFLTGFSGALLPAWRAWEKAEAELRIGRTIHFVAESFRRECAKPDRNIENWKRMVAPEKDLESIVISELKQGEMLRALKAVCVIGGEYIVIIGLCVP